MLSTSARTQRGSGSSTGAGPDAVAVLPAGTMRLFSWSGRALIAAATAGQPRG
ncbi:hypothetical protein JHV675_51210 [Mycobacterium avium subsp. hominissuis]